MWPGIHYDCQQLYCQHTRDGAHRLGQEEGHRQLHDWDFQWGQGAPADEEKTTETKEAEAQHDEDLDHDERQAN